MADISVELRAIMNAVYGEEVRGSIRDALTRMNNDCNGLISREQVYQMTVAELEATKARLLSEFIDSISDDYPELSDRVKLGEQTSISWESGKQVIASESAEQGAACTNYIPVTYGSHFEINVTGDDNLYFVYTAYDANKKYIRGMNMIDGMAIPGLAPGTSQTADITYHGFIRITAYRWDPDNDDAYIPVDSEYVTECSQSIKVFTPVNRAWSYLDTIDSAITNAGELIGNKGEVDEGTDLNGLTDNAVHVLLQANSYVNAPPMANYETGFLTVKTRDYKVGNTAKVITLQTYEASDGSSRYTRRFINDSWSSWVDRTPSVPDNLLRVYDATYAKTNLNEMTDTGVYWCPGSKTYTNSPVPSGVAGWLTVMSVVGGAIIRQKFEATYIDGAYRVYTRQCANGTFGSWVALTA